MSEESKDKSESQEENSLEKEDNRLPYEPPKLRKHGKVSNATQTVPRPTRRFDGLPIPLFDLS